MEQRAAPLDVLQEAVPEARALGGAWDEAGNVGEDEARLVTDAHHAEVRRERRERVIRDLRLRARDRADERRLADVREAEETHVGHHLELEAELQLLAGLARLGAARGAVVRRREVDVAAPALAAARDDDARVRRVEIVEELVRVAHVDLRTDRTADEHLGGRPAVAVGALAVLAVLAADRPPVREIEEGGEPLVGDEDDVRAASAVATGRAPERDELLAPERHDAVAAAAGHQIHVARIDELHGRGIDQAPTGGQRCVRSTESRS